MTRPKNPSTRRQPERSTSTRLRHVASGRRGRGSRAPRRADRQIAEPRLERLALAAADDVHGRRRAARRGRRSSSRISGGRARRDRGGRELAQRAVVVEQQRARVGARRASRRSVRRAGRRAARRSAAPVARVALEPARGSPRPSGALSSCSTRLAISSSRRRRSAGIERERLDEPRGQLVAVPRVDQQAPGSTLAAPANSLSSSAPRRLAPLRDRRSGTGRTPARRGSCRRGAA